MSQLGDPASRVPAIGIVSTPITDISIGIPSSNTSGQITDTQDWQLVASSIHVYGSGAQGAQCMANGYKSLTQPVRGSPGTYGLLMLSGCNVPVGGSIEVFFEALDSFKQPLGRGIGPDVIRGEKI